MSLKKKVLIICISFYSVNKCNIFPTHHGSRVKNDCTERGVSFLLIGMFIIVFRVKLILLSLNYSRGVKLKLCSKKEVIDFSKSA